MSATTFHGAQNKVGAKAADPAYTDAASVIDFGGEQTRDLVERHELGSPDVQEVKAGMKHASVEFGGDWSSANFSANGERLEESVQNGTEMDVALFPEGDAAPKVQFDDCKLSSWRITADLNGLVKYAVRGIGKGVTITP